jgi:hypothetical protein
MEMKYNTKATVFCNERIQFGLRVQSPSSDNNIRKNPNVMIYYKSFFIIWSLRREAGGKGWPTQCTDLLLPDNRATDVHKPAECGQSENV